MGYTTEFTGRFDLDRELSSQHYDYLLAFSQTRRMRRDPELSEKREDLKRTAAGLPIGVEGEFFVGETGFHGQDKGADVVDKNKPPKTQPGLWCQWEPTPDRSGLRWNGAEKFYAYEDWLRYLIQKLLVPWGYKLEGSVSWIGEEYLDSGVLSVVDDFVTVDTLELHEDEPDTAAVKDMIESVQFLDNADTELRLSVARDIVNHLNADDVKRWLYQPAMFILNDLLCDDALEVGRHAARSLNSLVKRGLIVPDFISEHVLNPPEWTAGTFSETGLDKSDELGVLRDSLRQLAAIKLNVNKP